MRLTPLALAAALLLPLPATAQTFVPGVQFIENWDYDGDGKVSLDEAKEKRADIFAAFDADENGALDSEEYDVFDQARAADMENNADTHAAMGQGFVTSMDRTVSDLDRDGQVTLEEFVGGTPDWFAMRDRTGDGFITAEDFGPRRSG